jgi:hypothetical protein
MKIYIAGPMSGYPDFNFPAFMEAAKRLRENGWVVFNPVEKDVSTHGEEIFKGEGNIDECEKKGFSLREAFAWDTARICESDAIYMLKGWEKSSGAFAEWALAKTLRLEIIYE